MTVQAPWVGRLESVIVFSPACPFQFPPSFPRRAPSAVQAQSYACLLRSCPIRVKWSLCPRSVDRISASVSRSCQWPALAAGLVPWQYRSALTWAATATLTSSKQGTVQWCFYGWEGCEELHNTNRRDSLVLLLLLLSPKAAVVAKGTSVRERRLRP